MFNHEYFALSPPPPENYPLCGIILMTSFSTHSGRPNQWRMTRTVSYVQNSRTTPPLSYLPSISLQRWIWDHMRLQLTHWSCHMTVYIVLTMVASVRHIQQSRQEMRSIHHYLLLDIQKIHSFFKTDLQQLIKVPHTNY